MSEPMYGNSGPRKPMGKNTKLWLIGGAVGAGVFYFAIKRKNATASAATADTTDPNIDPTTGLPYSSDYSAAYGGYGTAGGGSYGGTYPLPTSTGTSTPTFTTPTTIPTWVQASQAYLDNAGYTEPLVLTSLGKYVAGAQLSPSEYVVVESAIAAIGPAPGVATPKQAPLPGQVTTLSAPILTLVNTSATVATLHWNVVNGGTYYALYRNNIQIYTEMASTGKHSFAVPRIIGGTYTVKAKNAQTISAASNAVKVTT